MVFGGTVLESCMWWNREGKVDRVVRWKEQRCGALGV